MGSNTGRVIDLGRVRGVFEELSDQRKAREKRYALATVLLVLFLAKLSGEDKVSGIAEWARWREKMLAEMLGLKRAGMPSHNTYRRILAQAIDVEEFERVSRELVQHEGEAGYQVVVSMDGKVLRGTIGNGDEHGLCLLALYLPGQGLALAQIAVTSKQNEISAAPLLLGYVNLRNKVVIGDVLHTQRQVSILIETAGGHFLCTVKGNQPQLIQDLRDWFDVPVEPLPG